MADVLGEGVIRIRSDTSGFESSTRSSILGTVGKVGGAAAGLFAGFKVFDFVKDSVIGFNSTLEQSRSAFTNLLGSGDAANKMLSDLQEFAKTTPFAFEQLIPVSQQLVGALGKSVDVTATMRELGDAVSATGGSGEKLGQLTLAYTQLATSGTAHLGDLMQINNAVPGALARMAQAAGLSVGDFRDKVSKGLISSGEAVKLFHTITTDKKFGIAGGMDAQSKTFAGAMSNIGDALQQGLASAGEPVFAFVSSVAKGFAGFLTILQDTGSVFGSEMDQFFGQFGTGGLILLGVIRGIVIGFGLLRQAIGLAFAALTSSVAVTIFTVTFEVLQATIEALIPVITGLFDFVSSHQELFTALAIGFGVAAGALLALSAVMVITTAVAGALGAALALAFSPLVIFIVTIGLLVAGIILLYRNSQTARTIIDGAWAGIQAIVGGAISFIRGSIATFVAFAQAVWGRFGNVIIALSTNAFNTIMGIVRGELNIIKGIINVFIGLFTGDWGRMWNGIKQIATGALGVLRSILSGAIGALGILARSIGQAILNGIVNFLQQLPGRVRSALGSLAGILSGIAGQAFGWALSIGEQIVNGVISGIGSLGSKLKDSVEGAVHSALDSINPFSPVEHGGQIFIGEPIVAGALAGVATLGDRLGSALETQISAAARRAAVVGSSLQPVSAPLTALQAPARGSTLPGLLGGAAAGAGGITINGDVIVRAEHPEQLADELNKAAERAR